MTNFNLAARMRCGKVDSLRAALEAGADPNEQDVMTRTAIYKARTAEQVRALIAAGAVVNWRVSSAWGTVPWYKANATPLHMGCGAGQAAGLIEAGADVNARDCVGKTPLHWATDVDRLRVLIEAGADVNARDSRGKTPLHHAGAEKSEVLLAAGANVNAESAIGYTPLLLCLYYDAPGEQIEVLLEHGAVVPVRHRNDPRVVRAQAGIAAKHAAETMSQGEQQSVATPGRRCRA